MLAKVWIICDSNGSTSNCKIEATIGLAGVWHGRVDNSEQPSQIINCRITKQLPSCSWFNPNNQVAELRNYLSTAFYGCPRKFGVECLGLQLWNANPCAAPFCSNGSPGISLESKHTWLKERSDCQKTINEKGASVLCKKRICTQTRCKMSVKCSLETKLTLETNCFQFAVLLECACSEHMTV